MSSVVLKYQMVFWYYLYMMKNHLKTTTKHTTQLCHQSCHKEKEMTETNTTQISIIKNTNHPRWSSVSSDDDGKNFGKNDDFLVLWEMLKPKEHRPKSLSKYRLHLYEETDRIGLDETLSREEKSKKLKPLFEKLSNCKRLTESEGVNV